MNMKWQVRRELHKVTQYKEGCVYRTAYQHDVWIDMDTAQHQIGDNIYASLSTARSKDMKVSDTMRKVAEDTPDVVKI